MYRDRAWEIRIIGLGRPRSTRSTDSGRISFSQDHTPSIIAGLLSLGANGHSPNSLGFSLAVRSVILRIPHLLGVVFEDIGDVLVPLWRGFSSVRSDLGHRGGEGPGRKRCRRLGKQAKKVRYVYAGR